MRHLHSKVLKRKKQNTEREEKKDEEERSKIERAGGVDRLFTMMDWRPKRARHSLLYICVYINFFPSLFFLFPSSSSPSSVPLNVPFPWWTVHARSMGRHKLTETSINLGGSRENDGGEDTKGYLFQRFYYV